LTGGSFLQITKQKEVVMRTRLLVLTAAAAALGLSLPCFAATFTATTVAADMGAEPTLDVAPDGTLYITTAPALVIGQVPPSIGPVFRSDDGGASWINTPPDLRQFGIGGADMDLVVAPDGTIATTDLWIGSASVSVSHDKGQTWLSQPLQGVVVQDRQWLAATPGFFYHVVHQIPAGDVVSVSTDGLIYPAHFVGATPLDQTGCICAPGNMVAEGSGALASDSIAFVYPTTTQGVGVSRSSNGGLTWSVSYPGASVNPGGVTGFPIIADGGAGKLAVVWQPETTGGFYLVTSDNFGATWSTPQVVENTGTSVYPWVAYRNGVIAISYYHTTASATVADNVPANAVWSLSYKDSTDGFATRTDIEPVKSGPICTQGAGCSDNRELLDFQSVAIDNAGLAVIAYTRFMPPGPVEIRFAKQAAATLTTAKAKHKKPR
jgi:hypothetical protein